MGKHAVVSTTTQSDFPLRAALRTAVQVGIPAFLGLLLILPLIIQEILTGLGEQLPPGLYAWLAGAAAVITAISATLARISAIPGVVQWTREFLPFLAPDKK
jgi:hypothetical protein